MSGKHDKSDPDDAAGLLATGPIVVRGLGRGMKDALLPNRPRRHRAPGDPSGADGEARRPSTGPHPDPVPLRSMLSGGPSVGDSGPFSPLDDEAHRLGPDPGSSLQEGRRPAPTYPLDDAAGGASVPDHDGSDRLLDAAHPAGSAPGAPAPGGVLPGERSPGRADDVDAFFQIDDALIVTTPRDRDGTSVGAGRNDRPTGKDGGLANRSAEAEAEAEADAEADADAEPDAEPEPDADADAEPEAEADADADAEAEAESDHPVPAEPPPAAAAAAGRPPGRPRPLMPWRTGERRMRSPRVPRLASETVGIVVLVVLALICAGLIAAVVVKTQHDAAVAAQEAADYTPPPLASPAPSGPVVAVIGDDTATQAASGVDAEGRWTSLLQESLGGTVTTDASAGMGYAAKGTSSTTFVKEAAKVPQDADVVVFVGGAADARVSSLSMAMAATNAFAAAMTRAPDAKVLVVGPLISGGSDRAALTAVRETLRSSAAVTDVTWIDPIEAEWLSSRARASTSAADLTASDEKAIAARMRSAIAKALG